MQQADWKIAGLFVVSVICMLWIGLDSRETDTGAGPLLSSHSGSLKFQGRGLAYTRPLSLPVSAAPDSGITLYLILNPAEESLHRGFQFIASLSSGDNSDQFVIAQWRNGLIVMSGDDYDYSRRNPRLETQIAIEKDQFVAISISAEDTTVMLDGRQVATLDHPFRLPAEQARMRLSLGNALNSRNPWHGQISGFALVAPAHSASESIQIWQQWAENRQLRLADPAAAGIYFNFEEATESLVTDVSWHGNDLLLTDNRPLLHPEFTSASLKLSSAEDMAINIVGFIPFGFLLAWLLCSRKHYAAGRVLLIVVLCSGLLSGSIELTQAWLPARTSSLLDLLLNISGGGCGAVVFSILHSRTGGTNRDEIAGSKDRIT